jgi:hypothetical protein
VADDKDAAEKAKELFVYGPIGLALYVRDTAPSFLKLFVARGRNEFDQRRRSVEGQLDQARTMGETAAATSAPQVLRIVSDGLSAVRGAAEEALGAFGVRPDEPTNGSGHPTEPETEAPSPVAVVPDLASAAGAPSSPSEAAPPAPTSGRAPHLAIPDYDELSASQVVDRLEGLRPEELAAIRDYESAHRGRNTILGKIEQLGRT